MMDMRCYEEQEQRMACHAMLRWVSKRGEISRVNVLNDCFNIWHAGPFATANGLRVGRHPLHQVQWSEINAALGDILLIMKTARFNFSRYILLPMGNHSKLSPADDNRTHYCLYTDDSFSILPKRHFNQAMSAFFACAKELGNFMETCDPVLRYPYEMSSNKVNSLSGLHTSDEETWTRAMKFLLTNIKWAVVWAAKHATERTQCDAN
mmetsp:Transcript_9297/g.29025  ORF Transcript_9297/g.29025 Transcript_9297/m.29025 type:complete len:208 (-) Transcript_9297:67-690(-)